MATNCKYCSQPEDKQQKPGLICENCICFVHLCCLRRPGTPGDFACDVFFDFICADCSDTKKEVFVRNKFPWVNAILLTLHHLSTQSYGISNHGYFHYKTHICSFIDKSWSLLFGQKTKQKKNWVGTIAGVLSVYNNLVFRSGSLELGETGWWKLMHGFSPCVAAHIIQELARDKPKGRPRNQMGLDYQLFIGKVTEMGYLNLIHNEEESGGIVGSPPAKKKRHYESSSSKLSVFDQYESDSKNDMLDYSFELTETPSEADSTFKGFDFPTSSQLQPYHSDSSSIHSLQQAVYDSDTQSAESIYQTEQIEKRKKSVEEKPHVKRESVEEKPFVKRESVEEKPYVKRESLFSTELNSIDMPWKKKLPERNRDLVEMTHYEEIHLLKQIEGMIPRVKDPNKKADLCRIRANLALRRLKRHKHLPIFDLDKAVKLLGGYILEDAMVTVNVDRVLDRFQRTYLIDNLCGTIASTNYGTVVLPRIEPALLRSAYSGALLKPFIRRDADTVPLWLSVQDELLRKTHKHIAGYEPPRRGTVDFSYVQPQHMAAVNSLCAQFFWPGIDLTEALQYPEFSCVVTYKRLVVGCAFLVPEARPGEAYISFVLTRPEWRNAGIASFMLYHLLQTCSGKDVTLHVSPTNSAIFLYQKFGFKVEELIQDFYEKYYDIDYKGCRHALFLRLIR